MHEWIQTAIASMVFLGSGIAAVLRVGYLLGQHEKKSDDKLDKAISEIRKDYMSLIENTGKEQDDKRTRVYERFDRYKDFTEATFVRKDMCAVLHASTSSEMGEMKAQIKGLSDKIDELKNIMMDKKAT